MRRGLNGGLIWKGVPGGGGFFERMVGCIKRCFRKVLGNAKLTFDELLTVLTEVEATLNCIPLTYEYEELGGEMLTPSHLLYGRITVMPNWANDEEEWGDVNDFRARFHYLCAKLAHPREHWKEYLCNLHEYHNGRSRGDARAVDIGDVIVSEEGKKRNEWRTAIVEELISGKDEVVRGVKLRTIKEGKLSRLSQPVQRLVPLEISTHMKETGEKVVKDEEIGVSKHLRE